MRCDLCGSTKDVLLVNHYEERLNPPRVVNTCGSCHTRIQQAKPRVVKIKLPAGIYELIKTVELPLKATIDGEEVELEIEGAWG